MRDITFRGKRTDNGEWVEGYLTRRPSAIQYGAHYSPWFIDVPPKDPDDSGGFYNVDRETVGQFTGLTDINGQRIFEGDIVAQGKDLIQVVEYMVYFWADDLDDCAHAGFGSRDKNGSIFWISPNDRVIGNIYDNPELLEDCK